MAAFKVVQEITSLDGNATSDPISLKSGYLRVTPAGGDAFVSVGSNPTATDNQSIFVPIDTPTVFKESVASIQTVSVTNASAAIKFGFPSGIEAPFVVGDTVAVTGCAPAGINTTSASVTAVTGPDPINGVQSGTVTLGYGDANLAATDAVGEIRKVVKVAVRGTGKTHISEVQIVGDF
jgi:hypothetical protein|tara:strand:- start:4 stop:540 length:537 start_codon:yes stop_codon:yes gene_type:complete